MAQQVAWIYSGSALDRLQEKKQRPHSKRDILGTAAFIQTNIRRQSTQKVERPLSPHHAPFVSGTISERSGKPPPAHEQVNC
jgi:hypothetical protein